MSSFFSTINRLASTSFPLPTLCAIVGSVLFADIVLLVLGRHPLPELLNGDLSLTVGSVALAVGAVGILLLAHALLPSCFAIGREVFNRIPILDWFVAARIPDKTRDGHYRIILVLHRAIEKNNKIVAELVAERRAEIERERKLRLFCAALFAICLTDLCFADSLARHIVAVIHEASLLAVLITIFVLPTVLVVLGLALAAFSGSDTDDWIPSTDVKGFMEEPLTSHRATGPEMAVSPLARHAHFPPADRP